MNTRIIKHRLFILGRIILSRFYRLLGPLNIYLQSKEIFCIRAGYHSAHQVEPFDDRLNQDEWQRSVYESALSVLNEMKGRSVIDLGCGSAYKLMALFGGFNTIGIELAETCNWLQEKYPDKKWLAFEQVEPSQLQTDLIICSDVIEHVKNPDELMDFLKKIKFNSLVISTPERTSVRGIKDFGPPENPSHYREWNRQEFKDYVSKWFNIRDQIITSDKSASQMLICKL